MSQASNLVFPLGFLLGGKYLARNQISKESHVVVELEGRECNQDLAMFLREKGKNINRMTSLIILECRRIR